MQPLSTRRAWAVDAPVVDVWEAVVATGAYRATWPWLEELAPSGWEEGRATRATVRAPAGYRLRLRITPTRIEPPHLLAAGIEGDASGEGTVTIRPAGPASTLAVDWSLRPTSPLLRTMTAVARPLMVRGHDWIIADGVARFARGHGFTLDRA